VRDMHVRRDWFRPLARDIAARCPHPLNSRSGLEVQASCRWRFTHSRARFREGKQASIKLESDFFTNRQTLRRQRQSRNLSS